MRKPMVTRTVESTEVKVMALDVNTAKAVEKSYNISGTYKDEAKLLKAVQNAYDTNELKNVHIVESKVVQDMYGMDMNYFLEHATKLDPETRKVAEA